MKSRRSLSNHHKIESSRMNRSAILHHIIFFNVFFRETVRVHLKMVLKTAVRPGLRKLQLRVLGDRELVPAQRGQGLDLVKANQLED